MVETEKKSELFDCYISGNIKQSQNCNIDVKQPNNNIVASRDITTKQNNKQVNDLIEQETSDVNNSASQGQVLQHANSKQNTEQPENNICDVTGATIKQNNNLDESK